MSKKTYLVLLIAILTTVVSINSAKAQTFTLKRHIITNSGVIARATAANGVSVVATGSQLAVGKLVSSVPTDLNNYQGIWPVFEPAGSVQSDGQVSIYRKITNSPNPFSAKTTFKFSLEYPAKARLIIYDVNGNEVATVVNEFLQAGEYSYDFASKMDNGSELGSGSYLYELNVEPAGFSTNEPFSIRNIMVLVK
jgi:hypothetical protein